MLGKKLQICAVCLCYKENVFKFHFFTGTINFKNLQTEKAKKSEFFFQLSHCNQMACNRRKKKED